MKFLILKFLKWLHRTHSRIWNWAYTWFKIRHTAFFSDVLIHHWVSITWISWLFRKISLLSWFSSKFFSFLFFINLFLKVIHCILCAYIDSLKLFKLIHNNVHWGIVLTWFWYEWTWTRLILRILAGNSGVRSKLLEFLDISFDVCTDIDLRIWNRLWK